MLRHSKAGLLLSHFAQLPSTPGPSRLDEIRTCTASNDLIAVVEIHRVVPSAAEDDDGAQAPDQGIPPGAAENHGRTRAAEPTVLAHATDQTVTSGAG